jgi:hypothetical protein
VRWGVKSGPHAAHLGRAYSMNLRFDQESSWKTL